jgi:YVTN family beta-propeller protein
MKGGNLRAGPRAGLAGVAVVLSAAAGVGGPAASAVVTGHQCLLRTAYVVDAHSNTVVPINTRSNTPGRPIPVGNRPDAIAITPDGKTAYVTNYNDAR